jgi:hypothetical protein
MVAALTFQLAADIIETSVSTSWQTIGRVGAITAIRTFPNYFLERDVDHQKARTRSARHYFHIEPVGALASVRSSVDQIGLIQAHTNTPTCKPTNRGSQRFLDTDGGQGATRAVRSWMFFFARDSPISARSQLVKGEADVHAHTHLPTHKHTSGFCLFPWDISIPPNEC